MNYSEIIAKLLALGLAPIPVAPYQDPNDKAHRCHKTSETLLGIETKIFAESQGFKWVPQNL